MCQNRAKCGRRHAEFGRISHEIGQMAKVAQNGGTLPSALSWSHKIPEAPRPWGIRASNRIFVCSEATRSASEAHNPSIWARVRQECSMELQNGSTCKPIDTCDATKVGGNQYATSRIEFGGRTLRAIHHAAIHSAEAATLLSTKCFTGDFLLLLLLLLPPPSRGPGASRCGRVSFASSRTPISVAGPSSTYASASSN